MEEYVLQHVDEDIASNPVSTSNEAARSLLSQWLNDDTNYDEEAWPRAKKAIEENKLSNRSRFSD